MIKFRQYTVVDLKTGVKARVHYSINGRVDGRNAVKIYDKDCGKNLCSIMQCRNDSDSRDDYFEKSYATIFENNPFYVDALLAAKKQKNAKYKHLLNK